MPNFGSSRGIWGQAFPKLEISLQLGRGRLKKVREVFRDETKLNGKNSFDFVSHLPWQLCSLSIGVKIRNLIWDVSAFNPAYFSLKHWLSSSWCYGIYWFLRKDNRVPSNGVRMSVDEIKWSPGYKQLRLHYTVTSTWHGKMIRQRSCWHVTVFHDMSEVRISWRTTSTTHEPSWSFHLL